MPTFQNFKLLPISANWASHFSHLPPMSNQVPYFDHISWIVAFKICLSGFKPNNCIRYFCLLLNIPIYCK